MKGDMGLLAKVYSIGLNTVNQLAPNVGLVATNPHTHLDMFDPDDKISGGQGFIYAVV